MSLKIHQTESGSFTYEYDGLPCGYTWAQRTECKRAAVATQNIIEGLGLMPKPGYSAEIVTPKEAKRGIHKAD